MRNAAYVVMCAALAACAGDPADDGSCLTKDSADVMAKHVSDLTTQIALVAGHQDTQNAVGFISVPHQAETMVNYYTLFMPCTEPTLFDPYCDGTTCSQIECNGEPSWTLHSWYDAAPVEQDGWTYTETKTDVTWPGDGDVLLVDLSGDITGEDGRDWSFSGTADYADGVYTLTETYPNLVDSGATTLEVEVDFEADTVDGTVKVGGGTVAELAGSMTATANAVDLCN